MVRIAEEYAAALLKMAAKKSCVEQVLSQADRWLAHPPQQLEMAIQHLPAGVLRDFMFFLNDKGRLDYAGQILEKYRDLALEYIGVIRVEVVSAAPLTEAKLEDLQRRLILRSGKRVQITHRIDSSLIAGLRLIAEGVVVDTSVKRQLADIREKLYSGGVFYPWMQ